jgi:diguanylate cyclase (GGDEF)-like protein
MIDHQTNVIPDIKTKTAFGVSLVSTLVITPFTFNNFLQGRYLLGLSTTIVVLICALNTWLCHQNRYHLWLNLYVIVPIITVATSLAIYYLQVAGSYWVFLSIFSLYFILPISLAWKTNCLVVGIMLPLALISLDFHVLIRFYAVMLGTSVYAYASMREIDKLYDQTSNLAIRDALTNLYNRTLLNPAMDQAISIHERGGNPMTLIMLDLDHFKKVNDRHGHDSGDQVLKGIARFLLRNLRASDMIFRLGGEEFLILLYNTGEATGYRLAEKLRTRIAGLDLLPEARVTASMGVVELQKGMDRETWLRACDQLLYGAKSRGRNRVVRKPPATCPSDSRAGMD